MVTDIAQFLLKPEGKGAFGHILTDFPKNVEQAKGWINIINYFLIKIDFCYIIFFIIIRLDEILEGVNLAIKFEITPGLEKELVGKYLQCKSCGKVFNLGANFSSPEGLGVEKVKQL